jgi:hypothetical protein
LPTQSANIRHHAYRFKDPTRLFLALAFLALVFSALAFLALGGRGIRAVSMVERATGR